MSKKTDEKETDLVVPSGVGAVLDAPPEELIEEFKAGTDENMEHVADAFFKISIKGRLFKVDGEPIGDAGRNFMAIILREIPVNTYFGKGYKPDAVEMPKCFSVGGLVPDASVEEKQSEKCAGCPHNEFGTAVDEEGKPRKGKACANTRRLVLKVVGVKLPCVIGIPPSSTKDLNSYLKGLTAKEYPYAGVYTQFDFETNAEWAQPTFERVGFVDAATWAAVQKERKGEKVMAALSGFGKPEEQVESGDGVRGEESAQDSEEIPF